MKPIKRILWGLVLTVTAWAPVMGWDLAGEFNAVTPPQSGVWRIGRMEGDEFVAAPLRDRDLWRDGERWIAWPTAEAYPEQGIFLNPAQGSDAAVCFVAPEPGAYAVAGSVWRNPEPGGDHGRDDGVIVSLNTSALPAPVFALWSRPVRGGVREEFELETTLDAGEALILRNNIGAFPDYDNHTVVNCRVHLLKPLPREEAARRSAIPAAALTLGDARAALLLAPDGKLLAIDDRLAGIRLAVTDPAAPAWKLRCFDGSGFGADDYPAPRVRCEDGMLYFTYAAPELPGVTLRAGFDSAAGEFRLAVAIDDPGRFTIGEIEYPAELRLSCVAGDYLAADGTRSEENAASLTDLADFQPLSLMYPGILRMQMLGFKLGKSALLVYSNDPASEIKWHHLEPLGGGLVRYRPVQRLIVGGESRPWRFPYDWVFKPLSGGDWNAMTRHYAGWARRQAWARTRVADRLERAPVLAKYIRSGCIRPHIPSEDHYAFDEESGEWLYRVRDGEGPQFELLQARMEEYERETGFEPGYWLPTWHGWAFDSMYPEYFPVAPWMGDFDAFRRAMIEAGRPVMYYLNPAHWVVGAPSYDDRLMARWQGKFWDCEWGRKAHRYVTPSLTWPRERETLSRLADTAGCNGVYLDVLSAAFLEDDNPAGAFHGYSNPHQREVNAFYAAARDIVTGPVMGEGRQEGVLEAVDFGFGYVGFARQDPLPLWQMVYGDIQLSMPYIDRFYHGQDPGELNLACLRGGILEVPFGNDYRWVSALQRVLSPVVGKRLLRYDCWDDFRISQWREGTVISRRPTPGSGPCDHIFETAAGEACLNGVEGNALVLVMANGDWSAYGVASLELDGQLLWRCDTPAVRAMKYGGTLMLYNTGGGEVSVETAAPAVRRIELGGYESVVLD